MTTDECNWIGYDIVSLNEDEGDICPKCNSIQAYLIPEDDNWILVCTECEEEI